MSADTNFTNKKPDLGVERIQGKGSAASNLNIVVEEFFRPKGVLTDNKEHTAIILEANLNSKETNKRNYHVYVPMVHQAIGMPMSLLSKTSPFTPTEAEDAYKVEVLTNFNDGTSYMASDVPEALNRGQMVKIVYSDVVGGIPSKGRIKKKLEGKIDPNTAFQLFDSTDNVESNIPPEATKNYSSSNRKSTSKIVPSPIKMKPSVVAKRNKKLAQTQKAPCREIYQNKTYLSFHNNYSGDIRIFVSECPDFKTFRERTQQIIQNTSGPGKAINLLNKNGLGAEFKKIMLDNFVGGPYMYQGKAEFTGWTAYKNWSAMKNAEYLEGTTSSGRKKRAAFGGKSYAEYWKSQGKLIQTPNGPRLDGAFDCLALPPYLCLKCGFLLNVMERNLLKTNSNYPDWYRSSQSFPINIEQWAATPGMQGRYLNPGGHNFTSAGDGAKLITSGKYKGFYKVNYFNASGHFAKNQYRRGSSAAYFKYNGERSAKNIVRYKGVGKTRPVELLLPWAMAYADYTGDFDKNA